MKIHESPEAKRWVKALVARHIGRLKLDDAPEKGTEQYADAALIWDEAFGVINATASECDKASRRVASNPTPWWREQLPAVLKAIEIERGSNYAQPVEGSAGAPSDRESAMKASADCEWCSGAGLVIVFHRGYTGSPVVLVPEPDGRSRRVTGRATLACCCEYGRWILRRAEASDDKHTARRLAGIDDVIAGRTAYSGLDPTEVHHDDDTPRSLDWRAHVGFWADESKRIAAQRGRDARRRDAATY